MGEPSRYRCREPFRLQSAVSFECTKERLLHLMAWFKQTLNWIVHRRTNPARRSWRRGDAVTRHSYALLVNPTTTMLRGHGRCRQRFAIICNWHSGKVGEQSDKKFGDRAAQRSEQKGCTSYVRIVALAAGLRGGSTRATSNYPKGGI